MATGYPYFPTEADERKTSFQKIHIADWQQFKNIDITFHSRLTIITGANGAGKTTLLNLLSRHFNWNINNIGIRNKTGRLTRTSHSLVRRALYPNTPEAEYESMGNISYIDGRSTEILIDIGQMNTYSPGMASPNSLEYAPIFDTSVNVPGIFIPSHRSIYTYQQLDYIPVRPNEITKRASYEKFVEEVKNKLLNLPVYGEQRKTTNYRIKATLTAWNAFGYENRNSPGKEDYIDNFRRFESILKELLPSSLKFIKLVIDDGEVILDCATKPFLLDSASGGVTSIIDIAWQIFMYSEDKNSEFVAVIDEIENHLHPAMQREFLPKLINAFPHVKFIISTHSPLMINSVRDASIYALRYEEDEVISVALDLKKKAQSSSQILDEILGVSFTMPLWAEQAINEAVADIKPNMTRKADLAKFRRRLIRAGLEDLMPEAIEKIIEKE